MKDRNAEGYPDPTAARAIKAADRPPEEIIMFRKMIKALERDLSCAGPRESDFSR